MGINESDGRQSTARMSAHEIDELERRFQSEDSFKAYVDELLRSQLAEIAERPTGIIYIDDLGRELDERIRGRWAMSARRDANLTLRAGPTSYIAAMRPKQTRDHPATVGGLSGVIALDTAQWVGLAVASGALGNSAYDLLSKVTRSFRARREAKRRRLAASHSVSVRLELTEDESKSCAYLALCNSLRNKSSDAEMALPELNDVKFYGSRMDDQDWTFFSSVEGKNFYRIRVPHGDPLMERMAVLQVW